MKSLDTIRLAVLAAFLALLALLETRPRAAVPCSVQPPERIWDHRARIRDLPTGFPSASPTPLLAGLTLRCAMPADTTQTEETTAPRPVTDHDSKPENLIPRFQQLLRSAVDSHVRGTDSDLAEATTELAQFVMDERAAFLAALATPAPPPVAVPDDVRRRSEEATQGEWVAHRDGFITPKGDSRMGVAIARGTGNTQKWPADRAFIVAAVKLVRTLIAAQPANPGDGAGVSVDIQPMGLSDGRTDYYVRITCGDRSTTPHVFRERYKAEYHVDHYKWIFGLRDEDPDLMAYDEASHPEADARPSAPQAGTAALQRRHAEAARLRGVVRAASEPRAFDAADVINAARAWKVALGDLVYSAVLGAPAQPEPTTPAAHPVSADGLREAAQELLTVCVEDFGYGDEGGDFPDADDDAVGGGADGPMAVQFGHMRRLRAALASPAQPDQEEAKDQEIARLKAAIAKDARVDAILEALLVPSSDPELGGRDHLPRALRDFLSEENGRAGLTGFNDGWAEGYAKAKSESAAPSPSHEEA